MYTGRREEHLESGAMTPLIDIVFQLMIFFLVTTSVLPTTKSAPQVEGNLTLGTPKQGGSTVNAVIQIHRDYKSGSVEYYVLQGNENSAEFYTTLERSRGIVRSPLLKNLGKRYGVYYTYDELNGMLRDLAEIQPKVLIRASRDLPYGEVVEVTNLLQSYGITKYGWVGGTLRDMQARIIKTRPGGR